MGSSSILIIGDNWRDQLDRYQSMEYADPSSPHIVEINRLNEARMRYPNATSAIFRLEDGREIKDFNEIDDELKQDGDVRMSMILKPLNGAEPFAEWARRQYGVKNLDSEEKPDTKGKHRWGWMRLNKAGEVAELVERTIPGGFFFFFLGTCENFLLKLGATGWNINNFEQITEITEGYAGSARLSDIDFSSMRQKEITALQERWDAVHRVAANKTWIPFAEIRQKYPLQTEKYDAKIEQAASHEWFSQPTLQKIYAADCTNNYTPEALDPMLLPRADYVQHCTKGISVLNYYDVIRHGEHLIKPNEAELLADLDDNVLLTMVAVKC